MNVITTYHLFRQDAASLSRFWSLSSVSISTTEDDDADNDDGKEDDGEDNGYDDDDDNVCDA